MEEKERILAKHKQPKPDEEEEKPSDPVVITEGGCTTEFVLVESVHYALVREEGLFNKIAQNNFQLPGNNEGMCQSERY